MISKILLINLIISINHVYLTKAITYKTHSSSASGTGSNYELLYIKGNNFCKKKGGFSKDTQYTCTEVDGTGLWDTSSQESNSIYFYAYGDGTLRLTAVGSRNYFKLINFSSDCGNHKSKGRTCFKVIKNKLYVLTEDSSESDSYKVNMYDGSNSKPFPTFWMDNPGLEEGIFSKISWEVVDTHPVSDDAYLALLYGDMYCEIQGLRGEKSCTLAQWSGFNSGNYDMYVVHWKENGGDNARIDSITFPADTIEDGTRFWRFEENSDGSYDRMNSVCRSDHSDAGRDSCLFVQTNNAYKILHQESHFPFYSNDNTKEILSKPKVPIVVKVYDTSDGKIPSLDKWLCEKGLDTSRCSRRKEWRKFKNLRSKRKHFKYLK